MHLLKCEREITKAQLSNEHDTTGCGGAGRERAQAYHEGRNTMQRKASNGRKRQRQRNVLTLVPAAGCCRIKRPDGWRLHRSRHAPRRLVTTPTTAPVGTMSTSLAAGEACDRGCCCRVQRRSLAQSGVGITVVHLAGGRGGKGGAGGVRARMNSERRKAVGERLASKAASRRRTRTPMRRPPAATSTHPAGFERVRQRAGQRVAHAAAGREVHVPAAQSSAEGGGGHARHGWINNRQRSSGGGTLGAVHRRGGGRPGRRGACLSSTCAGRSSGRPEAQQTGLRLGAHPPVQAAARRGAAAAAPHMPSPSSSAPSLLARFLASALSCSAAWAACRGVAGRAQRASTGATAAGASRACATH